MHHVAIMNPKLKFIEKILSEEKTIETRWYKHRIAPWNKIFPGDEIFFKNSGTDITAKAKVLKVEQYDNLNEQKVRELIDKNFKEFGLNSDIKDQFASKHIDKSYAILIWLKDAKRTKPMAINKSGFGNAAAWLTLPRIESILRID
ncbi:MAG: hypothetical protein ABIM99_03275 [Candidatus Dojkabacteria bacterium]